MKRFFIYSCVLTGLPLLLTGCVDKDYDLSDLDTTTDIRVDNLVLPVNLDAITLNDIFDIDSESKIQPITINGQEFYAVTEHGEINSQPINIPEFSVITPQIQPSVANFDLLPAISAKAAVTKLSYDYNLRDFDSQSVEIKASGIDDAVIQLDELKNTPTPVKITFAANLPDYATISFPELQLIIIKGLEFNNLPSNYKYNKTTGELNITDLLCVNNVATIDLTLSGIDLTLTNTSIKDGNFSLKDHIDLVEGIMRAEIDPEQVGEGYTPSTSVAFTVTSSVGDFEATHVSGIVEYKLTGDQLNIAPVDLTGVPDFLNQDGTDIKLANPQIYLNLNNPVAPYNLYYQTGIEFTAVRESGSETFTPDNNKQIATRANYAGPYNFLLSPENTSSPLPDYSTGLEHIPFTGLTDLLSGDGLPDQIEIKLIDPEVPRQKVVNFELGHDISSVSGSYDFIAPIALKNGSEIIYSDTKDGWSDDDLDKLMIEILSVEADVTSTIPMNATLTAYPIDKDGRTIASAKAETTIPANAKDNHIVIKMQGPIKDLDGITFTARLTPGSEEALAPSQTITLKNLKATVSGHYTLKDDNND